MPTPPTEHRFPCENCGASLRFSPGEKVLTCPYCGQVQTIGPGVARAPARQPGGGIEGDAVLRSDPATGRALQWDAGHKAPELAEIPLADGLRLDQGSDLSEAVRTVSCPNCGAKLELSAVSQSAECPFCATPVVTDTGTTRLIKPQGVLPFVLTEERAKAALQDWLKGLWFAPNGLKRYARNNRRMSGVYSPFWTFDAATSSRYSGQRGDAYYVTVYRTLFVNGRSQQVPMQERRVRWTPVSGTVQRSFNDVLVLASSSLPRRFTDALTPWDLSHLTTFRPEYLVGFGAEGYTVPLADGHAVAREEMAGVIATDVRRDIGGDEQRIGNIATDHQAETFKHILLPVWSAAYKYGGKSYRFVVNGQSGRVQGERPYSAWKIALAIILGLIVLALAIWLAQSQGWIDLTRGNAGSGGGYLLPGPAGSWPDFRQSPFDQPFPDRPNLPGTYLPVPDAGGYVIQGY